MGNASISNGRLGRGYAPAAARRDPFKEKAEREAAKRAAKARAHLSARARKGPPPAAGFYNPFDPMPRAAAKQPVEAPAPQPPRPSWRTLANGVVLKLVASRADAVSVKKLEREEALRTRQAGKSSSLVLVSSGSVMTASSEPVAVGGGGEGELVIPASVTAETKASRRSSGGGGGSASGGPPRDRVFNQDDLMGVLIVLAMLLLLALYLMRPSSAPAAVNPIVSTQFAATEPAEAPAPLADPFGDRPVDLTPKSPLPPEAAVVPAPAPAPAPTPACQPRVLRAWFCTAKSELTETARAALEKDLSESSSCLIGKELVVTGYADTRGSNDYNSVLGVARAEAVAQLLKAKGVKVAELMGVGELPGLADNQNCSNQRRVDVRLADGPAEPPSKSCAPPDEFAALSCG